MVLSNVLNVNNLKTPNEIHLPEYNGYETTFEDIIYSYFRLTMNYRGYSFKVKRTGFSEIDSVISSYASGMVGRGSCDGYFFSSDSYDSFYGLLELESTGNLEDGINQIKHYANSLTSDSLSDDKKRNIAKIKQRDIRLIVFDGQQVYFSLFNLDTREETVLLDREYVSRNRALVLVKIHTYFKDKQRINREVEEKKIVGEIARIIRGHEKLQSNKAFIMTILACIFGATKIEDFPQSLNYLESSQLDFDVKLFTIWTNLINSTDDPQDRMKITRLYEETAPQLFELSQERGMDLYGFIYEELATKDSKKEQGEYYTPRHTIRPIISSVFNNYLQWNMDNISNKTVLDPFCGSGGFLYEYANLIKSKINLDEVSINDILGDSLWGFDKNGVLSAELNLHLLGNIEAHLKKVKTSINWRKQFLYENDKKGKYDVQMINWNDPANVLKIKRKLNSSFNDIREFMKMLVGRDININLQEIYDLIDNKVANNENLDNIIEEYALSKAMQFEDFSDQNYLGKVDLLVTNVPYGKVTEANEQFLEYGQKPYGNSLEANALRECIDLLKPAVLRNGTKIVQGGVGIIVVPDSILENATNKSIREYMISRCDVLGIISLPEYTFSPYAMEKTYIIVIQKIAPEEFSYRRNLSTPTFMYASVCDGKANSQNRYKTNHIHEITIKYPVDQTKRVCEFIHNDFEPCFDSYANNRQEYISKIERAWMWSTFKNDPNWDQERIKEVWNKGDWEKKKGKKWGYFNIQHVTREQKVVVKKATLENKIRDYLDTLDKETRHELINNNLDTASLENIISNIRLSPSEESLLRSLDAVEENEILGKTKIQLIRNELIEDIDLNIDSSHYLGVKEKEIKVEDILDELKIIDELTEENIIEFFRNSFESSIYEPVKLMDRFDIIQGTQFSKEDAYLYPGNIPVFTAATDGPAYYVSESIPSKVKVKGPSLIWSRKGAKAGTIQIFDDCDENGSYLDFYVSDVSGTIKPKKVAECDLTFFKYYISGQVKKELQSVSNNAQLNKSKLENLSIYIPGNQFEVGRYIREKLK
ncbi:N-6 DNA methylase [Bacillus cereus]|uniref:N-6 DNA methylase n=1 Tax=Bacillus cereus TaxID=1396 RepID=UPI002AC0BACB|nr:N-6 DNA methylase [Bacillus cereus]MDZ4467979.1 N-6 DNA methylase [Bacillus cereus]MDZ4526789.1 N-6 DNA methylase [Bacillus cereus]